MLIIVILIFILLSSVAFTSFEISKEDQKHAAAMRIQAVINELNVVMYDYLLYGGERSKEQWYARHDSALEYLEGESFHTLKTEFLALAPVFQQLIENHEETQKHTEEKATQVEIDLHLEKENRIVSQLLSASLKLSSDATALAHTSNQEIIKLQRTSNSIISILMMLLALTVMVTSYYVVNSIGDPIKKLVDGTKIVGSGNLEHVIDVESDDELGDLAISFNEMTKKRKNADNKIKGYLDELKVLNEIDKGIIASGDNIEDLLDYIVREASKLTSSDTALVGLVENGTIGFGKFCGVKTAKFKNLVTSERFDIGRIVIDTKEPVIVEDYFSDKRIKEASYDIVQKEGLTSFLAIPLFSKKGDVSGILYVANKKKTTFTEESVRTLNSIANQCSVAIEHAKLNEGTKIAYEELKSLDILKSDIISNVSHELRTPITIMSTALDLLKEEGDKESRGKLVDMAFKALRRQNMIVDNLISAAEMQKESLKIDVEIIDLEQIIVIVVAEFKSDLTKKKIKTKVTFEKNLPSVEADFKKIQHIFRNLLHNAIKFSNENNTIEINAEKDGDFVKVCFKDEGIGMSKKVIEHLFEPLYQGDPSTTRSYEGTGEGLAVVKELVGVHGGEVWAESKEGKGSTFCFTIPIKRASSGIAKRF